MDPSKDSRVAFSTPWFTIVSREGDDHAGPYYALESADAVTILAVTEERRILLIEQFRPAHGAVMRELPSGHIEPGEKPEEAAKRELLEETGYTHEKPELLGILVPDTGRLAYRLWVYFAPGARQDEGTQRERELTLMSCSPHELMDFIKTGKMVHTADIAAIFLALQHKKLSLE